MRSGINSRAENRLLDRYAVFRELRCRRKMKLAVTHPADAEQAHHVVVVERDLHLVGNEFNRPLDQADLHRGQHAGLASLARLPCCMPHGGARVGPGPSLLCGVLPIYFDQLPKGGLEYDMICSWMCCSLVAPFCCHRS